MKILLSIVSLKPEVPLAVGKRGDRRDHPCDALPEHKEENSRGA